MDAPDRFTHDGVELVRLTAGAQRPLPAVVAALVAAGEDPARFFVPLAFSRRRPIELWHQSAFEAPPGTLGNPGGRCRSASVSKDGRVTFSWWQ